MSKNFRTTKIQRGGIKCDILLSELTIWTKCGWYEVKEVKEVTVPLPIGEVNE